MPCSLPSDLSAIEAHNLISSKELGIEELVTSCLLRIDNVNPKVNAVVTICAEQAIAEARKMDRLVTSGEPLPALFGLPILIKDLIETRGLLTTYGSRYRADHIPDKDAEVVRRLRRSGAIVIGKTNTPELGAGANTFNQVFGATRNPYDLTRTSGGSSGGSAAAIACRMAPLAIGSDFGGSLRIPASFCGVVGIRPTPGRVPSVNLAVSHSPLWTEGPMARNVDDAALCLSAIEGLALGDPRSGQVNVKQAGATTSLKDLIVGTTIDLGIATMDPGIRSIAAERLELVSSWFASAQQISIDLSEAANVFTVTRVLDIAATVESLETSDSEHFGQNVRTNLDLVSTFGLRDCAIAGLEHSRLMRRFQLLFDEVDVILAPTTGVPPFPVEHPFPSTVDGKLLEDYTSWYALTWAVSLTGSPVVSIPFGTDATGMPFGIQVIAPRHADQLAIATARELEAGLAALYPPLTCDLLVQ